MTLVALAAGAMVGLGLALFLLRARVATAAAEGRRLVDAIGWATVLPQMLAALGGIFAAAGVGQIVAHLVTGTYSDDHAAGRGGGLHHRAWRSSPSSWEMPLPPFR